MLNQMNYLRQAYLTTQLGLLSLPYPFINNISNLWSLYSPLLIIIYNRKSRFNFRF